MKRYSAILLLGLVLVGCGTDPSGSAPRAEPSLEDRVKELGEAKSVAVSVGDLDQDGIPEIVLSARNVSPTGPGLQTLGLEPSSAADGDSVVLTHDDDGNLIVALSNQNYDFSLARLVNAFASSALSTEFKILLAALKANTAACEIARALGSWYAQARKAELLDRMELVELFRAMLGLPMSFLPNDPEQRSDEDFAFCLEKTPQTELGCLAIQARYWVAWATASREPGFWNRWDHCYQVPTTPSGATCPVPDLLSTLCNSREHAQSGCCNREFVFDKVFRSDLRNMAPAAYSPANGPIEESMKVTLDGSLFSAFPQVRNALLSQAGLGTTVAVCFLNDLGATRNPITLSVDKKAYCGRNDTRDGHVLEGWVEQCISEDNDGVYARITGGGKQTRFSALNEAVGPLMLDRVRAHFAEQVESVLSEIERKGMCCVGSQVLGGTVAIDAQGGLDIIASSDGADACRSPDSTDDPDRGPTDGSNTPGASDASDAGSGGEGGTANPNDRPGSGEAGGAGGADSGHGEDGTTCGVGGCSNQQVAHDKKDPHLQTLDGLSYDFQATGEFLLFELTDDLQGPRAEIRQQPLASDLCPHVTLNTAVAVSVNASRVSFYAQDPTPLWVAGTPSGLQPGQALDLGAGSSVLALNQNEWEVRWPDGARLSIERDVWRGEHHLDVSLFAPHSWRGRTRGLLGDFDGNNANEFRTRQGALLSMPLAWADLYQVFGASYQIRADESIFEPTREAPFLTFKAPNRPALASMLTPDLLDGVEQICDATGVNDSTLREACILDVACSGGDSAQAEWIRGVSPPSASAQIAYEARFNAEHCQTLTPDGYGRIERIPIPTDGSSVVTKTVLEFGRVYKVRAWGTFDSATAGDGLSDAEYMNFSNPPASIIDSCSNVDIGVAINAPAPAAKVTRWGTECASHSYTLEVVGQGAPLDLSFHECKLDDNQGILNADLFALQNVCPGVVIGAPLAFINGGFETPNAGSVSTYQTLQAGSTLLQGWSIDAGDLDLIEGSFWAHAEGTQSLDLNGVAAGAISRLLNTTVGETYEVSFAMAANSVCAPTIKTLEVEAADQRGSFQFDASGRSYGNMGWQSMRFAFRAVGDSTRLTFRSLVGGSCGPALDDVRLARLVCPSPSAASSAR